MFLSPQSLVWLSTICKERFGHDWDLFYNKNGSLCLKLLGSRKFLEFDYLDPVFHQSTSNFACYTWDAGKEGFKTQIDHIIPMPSSLQPKFPLVEFFNNKYLFHYDVFGFIYWMLTRLEEIGNTNLDKYLRFPSTSSHAYKFNYLERPIVDEWIFILGQVIKLVYPNIQLKKHIFNIKVSHDVDVPSRYAFKTWPTVLKIMAKDLVQKREVIKPLLAPIVKLNSTSKLYKYDPYNTFDWLMTISENNNLKSSFYFLCGHTNDKRDADYDISHPIIRDLLRNINRRGHEIGIHPSFETYHSPALIKAEFNNLKRVMALEQIEQKEWGGRMHYLRWDQAVTLQAWDSAGLNYDSTLGYADRPGFRCGTCFEYPAFNVLLQERLNLRIRPLIAMECSILREDYLNLGLTMEALNKFLELKDKCKNVHGCFTLLWHNSEFTSNIEKNMYKRILES